MNKIKTPLFLPTISTIVTIFIISTGCSFTPKHQILATDPDWTNAMAAGRKAFKKGNNKNAVLFYRKALNKAYVMDSATQIADSTYNLAACYISLGDYSRARNLLIEAKIEAISSNGKLDDIILLDAKAAYLQGKYEDAFFLSDEILSDRDSHLTDINRFQVFLLQGYIAVMKGETNHAINAYRNAEKYSDEIVNPSLLAGLYGLSGKINILNKEHAIAAKEFDREVFHYRKSGNYLKMAQALLHAATAYSKSGANQKASKLYFHAARSFFSQEKKEKALDSIKKAFSEADSADDEQAKNRIRALMIEIKGDR
jgi:tetratricopeptide (TPR) repeat protein